MPKSLNNSELITAKEAAKILDVKLATIYSYAARGWLTSVRSGQGRARLYSSEDVQRLKARHDARAGHGPVAAGALRWGEPVLETTICEIRPNGVYYRGKNAVELAQAGHTFEDVADFLWGESLTSGKRWPSPPDTVEVRNESPGESTHPIHRMIRQLVSHLDTRSAEGSFRESRDRVWRCVRALSFAHPTGPRGSNGIAGELLRGWGHRETEAGVRSINAALILCAEHDLNASTLVARTVAGAGGTLDSVLLAGLAALSGSRHGGVCDAVEDWLTTLNSEDDARWAVINRLRDGGTILGFGHPLYPEGDPRARALLDFADEISGERRELALGRVIEREVRERTGLEPTLDWGLVMLSASLGLPKHAPISLFASGRLAGWVAHAREQAAAGFLLRPRSRYISLCGDD
ncbi:MAG: citrate/2-methylcitrate synthase [Polyangiaceae bacterium]